MLSSSLVGFKFLGCDIFGCTTQGWVCLSPTNAPVVGFHLWDETNVGQIFGIRISAMDITMADI
jgi:hypothetical protein